MTYVIETRVQTPTLQGGSPKRVRLRTTLIGTVENTHGKRTKPEVNQRVRILHQRGKEEKELTTVEPLLTHTPSVDGPSYGLWGVMHMGYERSLLMQDNNSVPQKSMGYVYEALRGSG